EGTTEPQWRVKEVEFRYGESRLQFDARANVVTTGGLTYVICRHDPGMLKQPVEIAVRLVRQRNFPPDELATIELPIPAKGQLSDTHETTVWSRSITARASNLSRIHFNSVSDRRGRKGM